jgi:hypothetical protein
MTTALFLAGMVFSWCVGSLRWVLHPGDGHVRPTSTFAVGDVSYLIPSSIRGTGDVRLPRLPGLAFP